MLALLAAEARLVRVRVWVGVRAWGRVRLGLRVMVRVGAREGVRVRVGVRAGVRVRVSRPRRAIIVYISPTSPYGAPSSSRTRPGQ